MSSSRRRLSRSVAVLLPFVLAVPAWAETLTVSGTVTDGSGAGWPLYARITVSGPGAPAGPVFTDPADGTYGPVELLGGTDYTLTVESLLPGYGAQTRTIDLAGSATEDFALRVDGVACTAPGYAMAPSLLFSENFSNGIPASWTVVDNSTFCAGSPVDVWSTTDVRPLFPVDSPIVTPLFAVINSDQCGSLGPPQIDTDLITPALDLSALSGEDSVTLSFNSDYRGHCTPQELVTLEIGTFEAGVWTSLGILRDFCGADRRNTAETYTTQAGNGVADVRFRFHYKTNWDYWWAVDDVRVTRPVCTYQGGGLLWGFVTDADGGGPIVGATVGIDSPAGSTLSIATPDDPNLADGYYFLAADAGSRTVTATAPLFNPGSANLDVAAGGLERLDLSLSDASFGFTPYPVRVRIPLGTLATVDAEVSNSGPGDGEFNLVETEPWLTVSPAGGTAPAGGGTPVTLTFDAGAAEPGDHRTDLLLETDTGVGPAVIPVYFTVAFLDVADDDPFDPFIHAIAGAGITAGCGAGSFCPNAGVTRAQMAVWLLLGKLGPGYDPPPATGLVFADVPADSFAADFIERLSALGITAGCGGGNFCPDHGVTRAQMAVFLLRALEGPSYVPPPATGVFADVPASNPFAAWIEELFERGITSGCSTAPRLYCPGLTATRGQMSVFLATTFGYALVPVP